MIAPGKGEGFADIFEGNAYQCGLLPLELPKADWQALADAVREHPGVEATIDLEGLTLTIHAAGGGPDDRDRGAREPSTPAPRGPRCHRRDAPATTSEISAHEARRAPWLVPATA